jgi:hypothetical protein
MYCKPFKRATRRIFQSYSSLVSLVRCWKTRSSKLIGGAAEPPGQPFSDCENSWKQTEPESVFPTIATLKPKARPSSRDSGARSRDGIWWVIVSVWIPKANPTSHSYVERFIIDVINLDEFIPVGGRASNWQWVVVLFSQYHKNGSPALYLFTPVFTVWIISLVQNLFLLVKSNVRPARIGPKMSRFMTTVRCHFDLLRAILALQFGEVDSWRISGRFRLRLHHHQFAAVPLADSKQLKSVCSYPLFSFSPSALTRLIVCRIADLCEAGPRADRVSSRHS